LSTLKAKGFARGYSRLKKPILKIILLGAERLFQHHCFIQGGLMDFQDCPFDSTYSSTLYPNRRHFG
jgi:hypothetical protein